MEPRDKLKQYIWTKAFLNINNRYAQNSFQKSNSRTTEVTSNLIETKIVDVFIKTALQSTSSK